MRFRQNYDGVYEVSFIGKELPAMIRAFKACEEGKIELARANLEYAAEAEKGLDAPTDPKEEDGI